MVYRRVGETITILRLLMGWLCDRMGRAWHIRGCWCSEFALPVMGIGFRIIFTTFVLFG